MEEELRNRKIKRVHFDQFSHEGVLMYSSLTLGAKGVIDIRRLEKSFVVYFESGIIVELFTVTLAHYES